MESRAPALNAFSGQDLRLYSHSILQHHAGTGERFILGISIAPGPRAKRVCFFRHAGLELPENAKIAARPVRGAQLFKLSRHLGVAVMLSGCC